MALGDPKAVSRFSVEGNPLVLSEDRRQGCLEGLCEHSTRPTGLVELWAGDSPFTEGAGREAAGPAPVWSAKIEPRTLASLWLHPQLPLPALSASLSHFPSIKPACLVTQQPRPQWSSCPCGSPLGPHSRSSSLSESPEGCCCAPEAGGAPLGGAAPSGGHSVVCGRGCGGPCWIPAVGSPQHLLASARGPLPSVRAPLLPFRKTPTWPLTPSSKVSSEKLFLTSLHLVTTVPVSLLSHIPWVPLASLL